MIFKGEYLEGKYWNGKGYNENGDIIFEIINGKGKGKEYNNIGDLIYEGEFLNGERNGKGKEYHDNILKYEGEFLNGERNGKGKEFNENSELIHMKDNIQMVKEMEKERNFMNAMVKIFLMENF